MSESIGRVVVPDLVGLPVDEARDLGHQAAAVVVVTTDVDGPLRSPH